jgi:HTH-type transcriptional regulator / antitoxin HigA
MTMELKPICTDAEYDAALHEVAPYFENEPATDTKEADRFEILVMLIEAYEARHYAIAPPGPTAT